MTPAGLVAGDVDGFRRVGGQTRAGGDGRGGGGDDVPDAAGVDRAADQGVGAFDVVRRVLLRPAGGADAARLAEDDGLIGGGDGLDPLGRRARPRPRSG